MYMAVPAKRCVDTRRIAGCHVSGGHYFVRFLFTFALSGFIHLQPDDLTKELKRKLETRGPQQPINPQVTATAQKPIVRLAPDSPAEVSGFAY